MELTTSSFLHAIPEQTLVDLRELNIPMHLSGYRCLCVANRISKGVRIAF